MADIRKEKKEQFIVNKKFDIESYLDSDKKTDTSTSTSSSIIKLIIEGHMYINETNISFWYDICAFEIACQTNDEHTIHHLILTHSDSEFYFYAERSIMKVFDSDNYELIKKILLLLDKPQRKTFIEKSNFFVLNKSCEKGILDIVKIIMECGVGMTDTSLMIAVTNGHLEIVKELMKSHQCDDNKTDIDTILYSLAIATQFDYLTIIDNMQLQPHTKAEPNNETQPHWNYQEDNSLFSF